MIIKLFKELGRRMDKQSEKLEILTNVKNLNKLEKMWKKKPKQSWKKYTRRNQQNTRWRLEGQFKVGKQGREITRN